VRGVSVEDYPYCHHNEFHKWLFKKGGSKLADELARFDKEPSCQWIHPRSRSRDEAKSMLVSCRGKMDGEISREVFALCEQCRGSAEKFGWVVSMNTSSADMNVTYDAQLKKMLAYIAADISSLLIQFQIFVSLVAKHPWEWLSTVQALSLGAWIIGSWVVGVAVTVAIIGKFHELVFLESKVGVWGFYDLFASKRSHVAEGWDKLFQCSRHERR